MSSASPRSHQTNSEEDPAEGRQDTENSGTNTDSDIFDPGEAAKRDEDLRKEAVLVSLRAWLLSQGYNARSISATMAHRRKLAEKMATHAFLQRICQEIPPEYQDRANRDLEVMQEML